ncbi:MAG: hypothetical protein FJ288_04705 [Planctomycetes bacterium]|nr:hypothetical protein [Planctomycetota bacterium]
MRFAVVLTVALAALVSAAPILAKDDKPGRPEGSAAPSGARPPRPAPSPGGEAGRESADQEGRGPVRVAPMFRDLTDADIADIMAFVGENMPWLKAELERMRDADATHFRTVCRHLRFEVRQLQDLKRRDPEGFRKAIEEKQLRFQAQDLASKARAAADSPERDGLVLALRRVIERLFDVEMATRGAQIGQLEGRLEELRRELKQRAAKRDEIVTGRLEDALRASKEPEYWRRFEGKTPEGRGERGEKYEKGDKGEKAGQSDRK